jgi:hypothetical protein
MAEKRCCWPATTCASSALLASVTGSGPPAVGDVFFILFTTQDASGVRG